MQLFLQKAADLLWMVREIRLSVLGYMVVFYYLVQEVKADDLAVAENHFLLLAYWDFPAERSVIQFL